MRVLGIDLGEKRVGLALSDETGTIASPLQIIEPAGDRVLVLELKRIARDKQVSSFVLGLPLHMDGREGPEAARARKIADKLHAATSLPVQLWDERWSTVAAERSVRESGRRRAGPVDHIAAALILQAYLDSLKARSPGDSEPYE